MVHSMPIRLAQVRLSPQDSYVPTRLYSGGKLRTLQATGYAPDGGFRPYHHGKGPETPTESEGNPICAGSHPKVPTCVNRIGMVYSITHGRLGGFVTGPRLLGNVRVLPMCAYENLTKPHIADFIQKAMAARSESTGITPISRSSSVFSEAGR